jgi:very-short-patch-repair endonuclease
MAEKGANPDRRVAQMAAGQHGVASIGQLREAGLSDDAVLGRVRAGRLHRLYRGVYAVGFPSLSSEGRWMAAVFAGGKGAALSHRSAAALWELLDPIPGSIEISIPTLSGRRRRAGIRIHRRAALDPASLTRRKNIPVTTPAQTIADLRSDVSAAELRRAVRQAEVCGFRTGLDEGEATDRRTRSELEHLFLGLCRRHRLPAPEVNVRVGPFRVDFLWRRRRLVVETDGYRYHRGAQAFEDDHDRDLELHSLGYDVVRLTYRQVTTAPDRAASVVADALGRSASAFP